MTVMQKIKPMNAPAAEKAKPVIEIPFEIERSLILTAFNGMKIMDAIVQRLKEEKANRDESISAAAEKEGMAFAQVAEYKELRRLVIQMKDEDFDQYVVDIAKDLFTGYENTNHLELYFEQQMTKLGLREESIRTKMTWIFGWFNGVKFFWDKLPEDLRK